MKKITLLLASAITILAGTIISPAIPIMERVLHPEKGISFLVPLFLTITSLSIAVTAPIAGLIADRWGRKPLMIASLAFYAGTGSAGLYLQSAEAIFASRITLGFAVAGIMTSTTTLIADYMSGKERERFLGYQVAFMAFGGFFFMVTGGLLASYWWRAPFAIYFISLALIPLVAAYIDEPACADETIKDQTVVTFSRPLFGLIVMTALMGMMLYFLIPTRLPFYLEIYHKLPSHLMGLFMGTGAVFISLMSLRYNMVHRYVSKAHIYALSFLVLGIGLESLAHIDNVFAVFAFVALTGLGFGLTLPNSTVWVSELAPAGYRGRMIGTLTSAVFFGQFLSSLFGEPIVRAYGMKGFSGVYGVGGFTALTIALFYGIFGFLKRRAV